MSRGPFSVPNTVLVSHGSFAPGKIAELSTRIFPPVTALLVLFLPFPLLLKHGLFFWIGLGISVAATAGCYVVFLPSLRRAGVSL